MGPNVFLSPLMVVVEAFSHLARLLSLTVRLWVNMMVSEMLYGIFLGLTLALFLFAGSSNALGYILAPVPLLAPGDFHRPAHFCGVRAGLCIHHSARHLPGGRGFRRALTD